MIMIITNKHANKIIKILHVKITSHILSCIKLATFTVVIQDVQLIVEPPISAVNQSVSFSVIMVCQCIYYTTVWFMPPMIYL